MKTTCPTSLCDAREVIGRTTDNCGTYRGCEACLADLDCLFNTRTNQCVLGEDAPPLREYVWSCPARTVTDRLERMLDTLERPARGLDNSERGGMGDVHWMQWINDSNKNGRTAVHPSGFVPL